LTDQTASRSRRLCGGPTFVTLGQLARIRDQNILFSPSRQAVFALNDTGTDIWRSLEEGLSPETISSEIASHGIDRDEATRYVQDAIRHWERLGLVSRSPAWSSISPRDEVSQLVEISGCRVRIVYPAAHALFAATIFRHLEAAGAAAEVVLELVEEGDRVQLFRCGRWILSCSSDELVVVLKGQLLAKVLERGAYELALHAAALVRDDRLLLLCASPGAGKTTLALGLAHAGFGFAGDDVTLLDSLGHGVGIAFAPAVKAGAWPLLAKYYPHLGAAPICRRPDRRRVRYLVPMEFASPSPRAVGWVILLQRQADASAALRPVDPVDALRGLLNGSFARDGELTQNGFHMLTEMIGSVEFYCLTYSSLEDAIELLQSACR
jgi:Coenzyme PQQ synthesis protein D (PqqD)